MNKKLGFCSLVAVMVFSVGALAADAATDSSSGYNSSGSEAGIVSGLNEDELIKKEEQDYLEWQKSLKFKEKPPVDEKATSFIQENFANEIEQAKNLDEIAQSHYKQYEDTMAEYEAYMAKLDSDEFGERFEEYAKYYKEDQLDQLIKPYKEQAQEILDKAQSHYDEYERAKKNRDDYMSSVQKHRIEPKLKTFDDSMLVPKFNPSGVFGVAFSGIMQVGLEASEVERAFKKEVEGERFEKRNEQLSIDDFENVEGQRISDAEKAEYERKSEEYINQLSPEEQKTVREYIDLTFKKKDESGDEPIVVDPEVANMADPALLASSPRLEKVGRASASSKKIVVKGAAEPTTTSVASADVESVLVAKASAAISLATLAGLDQLPTDSLTRYGKEHNYITGDSYLLGLSGGLQSYLPLCDDLDTNKTSRVRVTRFDPSECAERYYGLTPYGGGIRKFFSTVRVGEADNNGKYPIQIQKAQQASYPELMNEMSKGVNNFLKNRGDQVVLSRRELSSSQINQLTGLANSGFSVGSGSGDVSAITENGSEFFPFNPRFSNNQAQADKEAVEQGYCMMVNDKGGKYKIRENPLYNPVYDPYEDPDFNPRTETRHKRYLVGSGSTASVARIVDPSSPFAPRNSNEWQDLPGYGYFANCGIPEISTITQICGKKKFFGLYEAWNQAIPTNLPNDYRYYKKPISKGGKILVDGQRLASYRSMGSALYFKCMASNPFYGALYCCNIAQKASCRANVLKPVDPTNKLPLSYTLAHASGKGDKGLPVLNENGFDSYDKNGFKSNGYSWFTSEPSRNFGYNGPWIKSLATGDAGFGGLQKVSGVPGGKNIDRAKWAQYMLAIAGANPGYNAAETNSMRPQAHNVTCGTGGWEALKRYQMNCARIGGVNCICDYNKVFFRESQWGYVLDRASAYGKVIDSKIRTKIVTRNFNGKTLSRTEDETAKIDWPKKILMSRLGKPLNAQANYNVGGTGQVYPGPSLRGLDNAKPGHIIVMQKPVGSEISRPKENQTGYKRPWTAAFVESKNPNTGCLTVTTKNNHSIFLDACGNTESTGNVTEYVICPSANSPTQLKYPTATGGLPSCATNNDFYECYDPDWNDWAVYDPYSNANRNLAYSPSTGIGVPYAGCDSIVSSINELVGQVTAGGLDNDPRVSQIRTMAKQAQKLGCPPDPNWGVAPGQQSIFTSGDTKRYGVVPATENERSAPNPWGNTNLDSGTSVIDDIFPNLPSIPGL